MKTLITGLTFLLCCLNVQAETWKNVLSPYPSGMPKVSSSDVKFGLYAHIKISGWLKEHSDVSSPDEKAWELMGEKPESEIKYILDLIDLDIVERELMKQIEARRDVFALSLAHKNTIKEFGSGSDVADILKVRSSIIARIEKYKSGEKK